MFTSAVASINTQINSLSFCELSGANCFSAAKIWSLSGDVVGLSGNINSLSGRIQTLEALLQTLSWTVASLNANLVPNP